MSLKKGNTIVSKQRPQVVPFAPFVGFAHHKINEHKKHKAICSNNPLRDIFCTKCKTKYRGQITYDQHIALVHCDATAVLARKGHGCPPKSKK